MIQYKILIVFIKIIFIYLYLSKFCADFFFMLLVKFQRGFLLSLFFLGTMGGLLDRIILYSSLSCAVL